MIQKICPVCNKAYEANAIRLKHGRQTTCSRECSYLLRAKNLNKSVEYTCAICGKTVSRSPSVAKNKSGSIFCSPACHYKGRNMGIAPRPKCGPYKPTNQIPPHRTSNLQKISKTIQVQRKEIPVITDDAFGNWIAGMTDGDGSFNIIGKTNFACNFSLGLRDDDASILQKIQQELQFGKISWGTKRKTSNPSCIWHISSKFACLALIKLFDKYPLKSKKRNDYIIWREAVLLWTSQRMRGSIIWDAMKQCQKSLRENRQYQSQICNNPILNTDITNFGHWLAGFIDAEGCFGVKKVRRGAYYGCRFSLKLRDDDIPILNLIRTQTGIGNIRSEIKRSGNSKPCAIWSVDTKEDCPKLVTFLDQHPMRAKKAKDFAIWKEAVKIWTTMQTGNRWKGPPDWATMIALKSQLETIKVYKPH